MRIRTNPPVKRYKRGERLTARDFNRVSDMAAGLAQSSGVNSIMDSTGLHIRQKPPLPTPSLPIQIFQVQSATSADGVYNCLQQLSSGLWGSIIIEVLNAIENDTVAAYEPALAYGDRIMAWKDTDDAGTVRWMGMPLVPHVRLARTTDASGDSDNIICNLIGNDGEEEILTGLGSGITVYFHVNENDVENIEDAITTFADNDYLYVENISGKWWCVQTLQQDKICVCGS